MKQKIRAIIFDADGVLILHKNAGKFSDIYSKKLNVPVETIIPFFENEFIECLTGKKDLKEELEKQMKNWRWEKSVEELLNFWFSEGGHVNEPLLKYLPTLKKKGLKIYLGTNNEKHRTEYLLNEIGLNKHLDHIYASYSVGHKKPNKEFFEHIINDLNLAPSEILFVDDDQNNVNGAKFAGMQAQFYSGFKNFKKDLKKYL